MRYHLLLTVPVMLLSISSQAYLKQRNYFQVGDQEGIETVVHWNKKKQIKVEAHQFQGTINNSEIDFNDFSDIAERGIRQWTKSLLDFWSLDLKILLNNGIPFSSRNNCETQRNGRPDGVNNLLFTSKLNINCADPIARGEGVIGVTRVLYAVDSGEIVEADMQLNDVDYQFHLEGQNHLDGGSRSININDVFTHEFGHFLGLEHSNVRQSTMLYSIADDLQNVSTDDQLGVLSLYGAKEDTASLLPLKGSLVQTNAQPVFGATINLVAAETMEVVASTLTDLNGSYQFCHVPKGEYLVFVDRYRPHSNGAKIHSYYAGDGDRQPEKDAQGRCYNPACQLFNQSLTPFWWAPDSAHEPAVYRVSSGSANKYLNIVVPENNSFLVQNRNQVHPLQPGVPLAFHASNRPLPRPGLDHVGTDEFSIELGEISRFSLKSLSLGLSSRLALTFELLNENGQSVLDQHCEHLQMDVSLGKDPALECDFSNSPLTNLKLQVNSRALSCTEIPGNGSQSNFCQDIQSSNEPYYLLHLQDLDAEASEQIITSQSFSARSRASRRWDVLPACGAFKNDTTKGGGDGGGCAALFPTMPDDGSNTPPWWALWLSSPLILLIYALFWRLQRVLRT